MSANDSWFAAHSSCFILDLEWISSGSNKDYLYSKLPLLHWVWDGEEVQPVTTAGIYKGAYSLLLADGSVHELYAEEDGIPLSTSYPNEKAWFEIAVVRAEKLRGNTP